MAGVQGEGVRVTWAVKTERAGIHTEHAQQVHRSAPHHRGHTAPRAAPSSSAESSRLVLRLLFCPWQRAANRRGGTLAREPRGTWLGLGARGRSIMPAVGALDRRGEGGGGGGARGGDACERVEEAATGCGVVAGLACKVGSQAVAHVKRDHQAQALSRGEGGRGAGTESEGEQTGRGYAAACSTRLAACSMGGEETPSVPAEA